MSNQGVTLHSDDQMVGESQELGGGAPGDRAPGDRAPGEPRDSVGRAVRNYIIGLALAAGLTAASFWVAHSPVFWQPGVALGLGVLALAQQGIHLVFFLHLTTGTDNVNNSLAVAFGVLVIVLVGAGTMWIMHNLNHNMMDQQSLMDLHLQH